MTRITVENRGCAIKIVRKTDEDGIPYWSMEENIDAEKGDERNMGEEITMKAEHFDEGYEICGCEPGEMI